MVNSHSNHPDESFDLDKYVEAHSTSSRQIVRTVLDDNDDVEVLLTDAKEDRQAKKERYVPEYHSRLRSRIIEMPKEIYQASGINVFGKRIKSIMFTTDVALIRNSNAQAIIAVYPFTPQFTIMKAIIDVASVPVFLGVGGGVTTGDRSAHIAFEAEQLGAYGVVVNAPISNEAIAKINQRIEIPVIATIASLEDDYIGKLNAGADMLNISAGANTAQVVETIRSEVGNVVPIIATGGPSGQAIQATTQAGANAITYTPPSSADIFAKVMDNYRH